jgi:hypothetical protein
MSTGAIIAIVVGALILIVLLALLVPRMRGRAEERRREGRRQELAGEHRAAAERQAAQAELAEREAQRQRAEAELHEARAELHDRGLADEELDRDRPLDGDRTSVSPGRSCRGAWPCGRPDPWPSPRTAGRRGGAPARAARSSYDGAACPTSCA